MHDTYIQCLHSILHTSDNNELYMHGWLKTVIIKSFIRERKESEETLWECDGCILECDGYIVGV